MPTTYAHDLFEKRSLPETFRKITASDPKQRNLYRIGQHGPDILFYYFISKI